MKRALLWTSGCAFAAAALTFLVGIYLPELTPISQREGAYMMAVAFVYTPTAFILGAVLGLVIWLRRS
jgi:MFS family permease